MKKNIVPVKSNRPLVSFYLAPWLWPSEHDEIPKDWPGHGWSHGCWIVRTYNELSASGFPCVLTRVPPVSGIVVTYRSCLPFGGLNVYRSWAFPTRDKLVVCVRGDRARYHWAQVHISQNQLQTIRESQPGWFARVRRKDRTFFIPHWSLDSLIPRDQNRWTRIKNVVFFGNKAQLARELLDPEWEGFLSTLGMSWKIISDYRYCRDYSTVDVVIAIRDFSNDLHLRKPSWKILNAWFADALVISSPESSSRELRQSDYDYLEVSSYEQLKATMTKLASGKIDYNCYINRGRERREEFSPDQIVRRWQSLIENELMPEYYAWNSQGKASLMWFVIARTFEWLWLSLVGIVTYFSFTLRRIRHQDI